MNSPRHRVLERQIKRYLSEQAISSPAWEDFFASVSRTYTDFDEDRALLDRSLDLTSKEFSANNRHLEETRRKVAQQAQNLAGEVMARTKELNKQIAELEAVRLAMTNLLEDFVDQQDELSAAKAKDEALLASIGDGVIATERDGRIMLMNQAARRMVGRELEDVKGKFLFDTVSIVDDGGNPVPPERRPLYFALAGTTTTTTGPAYYYLRKDGTKFPVAIKASPIFLGQEIIGAIAVFRDITKEKEIDRMKSDFLNVAAHDLRTPISAIKGYVWMMRQGDLGPPPTGEIGEALAYVEESADRMINLVRDFLTVARIEQGKLELTVTVLDVPLVIKAAVREATATAKNGPVKVVTKIKPDVPKAIADKSKITQVLVNILDNAFKHTKEGAVTITAERSPTEPKFIQITVHNTGEPIRSDDLPHLFEKYYRGKSEEKAAGRGGSLGLGLHMAKMIIERHKGKIWVNNEPGQGVAFCFTVPIANPA